MSFLFRRSFENFSFSLICITQISFPCGLCSLTWYLMFSIRCQRRNLHALVTRTVFSSSSKPIFKPNCNSRSPLLNMGPITNVRHFSWSCAVVNGPIKRWGPCNCLFLLVCFSLPPPRRLCFS